MSFAPEVAGARVRPSANHGERTSGPVDILLLHYTGMSTGEAALDRLCDPGSEVSSHYLVMEDGDLWQLVPETRRAWHAGQACWAGETDINSRSIGIEIVNPGHEFGYRDFPEAQVEAVIRLGRELVRRHPIPPARVLAHSDVAPARKRDPGERFPWRRLAEAGLGLWAESDEEGPGPALRPGSAGPAVAALKADLAELGYAVSGDDLFDTPLELTVKAFQRRFRPQRIDGTVDPALTGTLRQLLALKRRTSVVQG